MRDPLPSSPVMQFRALTGLRGIAAWCVVLFHTRVTLQGTLPAWMLAAADKGYLAVDLFFILSGFVLWHSYGERLNVGMDLSVAARFWWRRIARIWPLHAAILAAFVLLAALLALTGRDTSMYPWAELPLHILLIQNWGLTPALSWNDPAWSISCELAAYLAFPLVVALAPWRALRTGPLLVIAALLLGAIWLVFAAQGANALGYAVPRFGLARCLPEFWLGNVLGLLWARWHTHPRAALAAWAAALALFAANALSGLPETALIPASFAALILALALDHGAPSRLLGAKLPHDLGEISYSTYLAHFLLFLLFKLAFVRATPHLGLAQLAAYLLLVLAVSLALHHGVEKPAQRWLNALALKRPSAAVTAE